MFTTFQILIKATGFCGFISPASLLPFLIHFECILDFLKSRVCLPH